MPQYYTQLGGNASLPYTHGVTVVAHATNPIEVYPTRALYVGTGGTLNLIQPDNNQLLLQGVPSGTILPISVNRIVSSLTTASNFVALF